MTKTSTVTMGFGGTGATGCCAGCCNASPPTSNSTPNAGSPTKNRNSPTTTPHATFHILPLLLIGQRFSAAPPLPCRPLALLGSVPPQQLLEAGDKANKHP